VKLATQVVNDPSADPRTVRQARRTLGVAQLRMALFTEARQTLTAALADDPDEPVLTARLAEAEEGLGLHNDAKSRLEPLRMKGLLPDADAHVALARALYGLGETGPARIEVDQALASEPDHPGALGLKQQLDKKPQTRS
jgi:uncharacterized protein HemY